MGKYIVKRLLIGVVTLFALATITFFLMHVIPGSPFAGETSKLPASVKDKLVAKYGLDRPIAAQFVTYLGNAIRGDFGTSLNRKGKEVVDIILGGLPATASLGMVAFVIAMEGVAEVRPNDVTQPAFGTALEEAKAAGVAVLHLPCRVKPNSLEIIAKNIFASTQPTKRSFGL